MKSELRKTISNLTSNCLWQEEANQDIFYIRAVCQIILKMIILREREKKIQKHKRFPDIKIGYQEN